MSDFIRVLAVPALVAGNAFFVIGEYAVVTARRAALAPRAERGRAGAQAALRLMDGPGDQHGPGGDHRDRQAS